MSYKLKRRYSGFKSDSKEILRGLRKYQKASWFNEVPELLRSREYTRMLYELQDIFDENRALEKHMGFGRDYPGHPMIDDEFKLSGGELEAFKRFKDSKPFQAPKEKWIDFIQCLVCDLAKVHGHQAPAVFHNGDWGSGAGTSFYIPHAIFLTGPRSLIVALHEYYHSLGYGEVGAVWWSSNAFRLVFPASYAKLEPSIVSPHLLITKKTNTRIKKEMPKTKEDSIKAKMEEARRAYYELKHRLDKLNKKKSRRGLKPNLLWPCSLMVE